MTNKNTRSGGLAKLHKTVIKNLKTATQSLFRNAIAVIWKSSTDDDGYYFYGDNDTLPNEIIEAINNSGTATACIEKLNEFTYAEGFVDTNLGNLRLNGPETWNEKLSQIIMNFSYLTGYALKIKYQVEGNKLQIFSVEPIDTQKLRRDKGGYRYNELMGEVGRNHAEDILMDAYVPGQSFEQRSLRIAAQIKTYKYQVGEIYYPFVKRMGRYYNLYPVPYFYSDIESIIADGKVSQFDLRNISQGWRAPIVISSGPVNGETEDETGKTEQDYWNEAIASFLGEDAAPVLHLQSRMAGEEVPKITVLPLQDIVDAADGASTRVPKRVCRTMGVPEVLVGIAQPGQLGQKEEMVNTMKLFALSIIKRQEFIMRTLDVLKMDLPAEYANVSFEITTMDVFGESGGAEGSLSARSSMTGKQNQNLERVIRKMKKGEYTKERAIFELTSNFGYKEEDAVKYLTAAITDGTTNNQG